MRSLHFRATKPEHSHPIIGHEFKRCPILGKLNKYRKEILWKLVYFFQ